MEALKNLMTGLQAGSASASEEPGSREYEQRRADLENEMEGHEHEEDGYDCRICRNKGYIVKVRENGAFGHWVPVNVPCKCHKVRTALARLKASGLGDVVKKYTFDNYQTPEGWHGKLKEAVLRYVNEGGDNWLALLGQSGAGKTHLCTAAAIELIRRGKGVRYMLWRDEIARINAVVNDAEVYGKLINELKGAEVLYIDDLFKTGKDPVTGSYKMPAEAEVRRAFEIINYRAVTPGKITIISSERTLAELADIDEATAGRIAEKSKEAGFCIDLKREKGRNWRMRGVMEV